jgi:hypothetical protein
MSQPPLSIPAFRAAEAAFEHELRALLQQHRAALGGELGVVHALVEVLGGFCAGVFQELGTTPDGAAARRQVAEQISALVLYLSTVTTTPL